MSGFSSVDGAGVRQTFRGLHLGTHPDADKAAEQILMRHVDEIVCSDGVRRTPADNLLANIAVSGIGGLRASQTEQASAWYKALYGYGPSGEGLWLEQAKDYYLDQSFTTARDASRALRLATSTATDKLAQGITFATAGKLETFECELVRTGTVTGKIWFTLEADAAGSPSGTPLATSDKIDASQVATSAQIVEIISRAPATGSAALYHLVLQGDYTRSDAAYVAWRGVVAGGYAGGSAQEYNGTTWSAATGVGDFHFKAYVTRNDNAVAPPAGYDTGYAHVGWVYNDSGSNCVPFWAQGRDVRFRYVDLGTSTATIATLTDLSAAVPPVPVRMLVDLYNDTNDASVYLMGVLNSTTIALGSIRWSSGAAGLSMGPAGPVVLDAYQRMYWRTSGGTSGVIAMGFEW